MKEECPSCQGEMKGCYEVNDEYVCEDCFQDAVSRAEYYYESAKEEGRI